MHFITKTVTLIFATFSLLAHSVELKQGEHYEVISSQPSAEKKLSEYFNYGCGGCYKAESFVKSLKKELPQGTVFEPVPFENHAGWKIYVEAFYIAEMLGAVDKMHDRIFHRVHVERKPITDKSQLKDFFASIGIDVSEFDKVASSFQLNTKIRMARQNAIKARVFSTPTYIINDHYKVNATAFKTYDELKAGILELINR